MLKGVFAYQVVGREDGMIKKMNHKDPIINQSGLHERSQGSMVIWYYLVI